MRWVYDKEDYIFVMYELSILLFIISIVLTIPLMIAFIYGEKAAYVPFIGAALISALMGAWFRVIPYIYFQHYGEKKNFARKHAIGMVVLSWPLVSLPSAVPLHLINPGTKNISYLDAFFEAISGWTTTGLTTFGGEADMFLHSINFWRHFMQYLGGLGIVVMGLLVLMPVRNWESTMELISA
ncbi:MAG: potassium transporter TrkG, partial [Thermoplasmatota archaeon]